MKHYGRACFLFFKGIMKIVLFFIGWIMAKQGCDAAEKELQSLKATLESNL